MRANKGRYARWAALALLVGALSFAAAGCGGDDDDEAGGDTAAETAASGATPADALPSELGEGEGRST